MKFHWPKAVRGRAEATKIIVKSADGLFTVESWAFEAITVRGFCFVMRVKSRKHDVMLFDCWGKAPTLLNAKKRADTMLANVMDLYSLKAV